MIDIEYGDEYNIEKAQQLKSLAFDKQRNVIRDRSKRIALHVGRRGAKTSTIVIWYLMFALLYKNIRLVFIGLTGEATENAFLPIATEFLQTIGFYENREYRYNRTERLFEFPITGSTISLKGYDVSYKEMDKILGGKCFAVHIDECQSQTQDIEKAILYKIQQAVSDYLPVGGGIISLSGTSGDYMGDNMWYKICDTSDHLGWSYHTWLDKENPHMLEAKTMEDAQFLLQYGEGFQELDWYQQQYLNKWIKSGKRIVYQVGKRNYIGQPECKTARPSRQFFEKSAGAEYGLGLDWGFSPDPMAFVVVCFNTKFMDKMVVVKEYKQKEMYLSDIDNKIVELKREYNFSFIVSDTAKQSVADLNKDYGAKHGYLVLTADKLGKLSHQNTMNSDLRLGNILIDPLTCSQLIHEMENLEFDPVKLNTENKRVEKEGMDNHLCDALLYAHFYSRHLWYQAPTPKYIPTTPREQNIAMQQQMFGRKKPNQLYADIDFATGRRR